MAAVREPAREFTENELEQVSGGFSPIGNQDGTGRSNVSPASLLWSVNFTGKSRES